MGGLWEGWGERDFRTCRRSRVQQSTHAVAAEHARSRAGTEAGKGCSRTRGRDGVLGVRGTRAGSWWKVNSRSQEPDGRRPRHGRAFSRRGASSPTQSQQALEHRARRTGGRARGIDSKGQRRHVSWEDVHHLPATRAAADHIYRRTSSATSTPRPKLQQSDAGALSSIPFKKSLTPFCHSADQRRWLFEEPTQGQASIDI